MLVRHRSDKLSQCLQVAATSNAPAHSLKLDDYYSVISININGTMLCIRAVSKAMSQQECLTYTKPNRSGSLSSSSSRSLGRGVIVNLGSVSSFASAPGMMAYTASKHAVVGLTKNAGTRKCPNSPYPFIFHRSQASCFITEKGIWPGCCKSR